MLQYLSWTLDFLRGDLLPGTALSSLATSDKDRNRSGNTYNSRVSANDRQLSSPPPIFHHPLENLAHILTQT